MSENTWEIMKGMELGDVELQMALQCAPVITGVKVSNLLNIELSGYRQMVEILKDSDICMYTPGSNLWQGKRIYLQCGKAQGICSEG